MGLGWRVWGAGCRVVRFRVQGVGRKRVWGTGCRGAGCRVVRCRVGGFSLGCRASKVVGFRVCRVWGGCPS